MAAPSAATRIALLVAGAVVVTFEIERDFSRIARLKTGNVRRYLGSVFGNILLAVVRSHYTFYEAAMFPKQNECLYLTCTVLQLVSYIYIYLSD